MDGGLFSYAVASRAIHADGYSSGMDYYEKAFVSNGSVCSGSRSSDCYSGSNYIPDYDFKINGNYPIKSNCRPVVVLPSNIKVEEGTDGVYKLAE